MRHIDYPGGRQPDPKWLEDAKALTKLLEEAPDKAARDKIIDENAVFWGKVKEWLATFSDNKCWFSEARDVCSHWQVEHFRPKKEAKDSAVSNRDGYWWLAFDYMNYRLCGGVVNAKKGSYFPLRAGTAAATCPQDNCDDESPLLIDPTDASDVMLVTFAEGGKAVPSEPEEGWHRERALKSIERYKLNAHAALSREREKVWNACKADVELLEELFTQEKEGPPSPTRRERMRQAADRLRARTLPSAEFSAVARAFISQSPKAWVRGLIK